MANFTIICFIILSISRFGSCIFQERVNLTFIIEAVYKGENVDWIGVRGNGLGLNWRTSLPLSKGSDGRWTTQINFQSGFTGYKCMGCGTSTESCIANGDDLKIRFYAKVRNNNTEINHVGKIFAIPLPVSKVSTAFKVKPVLTFYPYFFRTKGESFVINVDSMKPGLGKRNIAVYVPPGLLENPKPAYDKYYIIDVSPQIMEAAKSEIDRVFYEGIALDVVLIGHGDWIPDPVYNDVSIDRSQQLTPVPGDNFKCHNGSMENLCNHCIPANYTSAELIYWMTQGGCGYSITYGGGADENIDFLLGPVYKAVEAQIKSKYLTTITESREGTNVIGYSLGGLFSCYTGWTRPQRFGAAGCHSSSFWWPLSISSTSAHSRFYFVNTTLNSHLNDRLPQKILIDVGEHQNRTIYMKWSQWGTLFMMLLALILYSAKTKISGFKFIQEKIIVLQAGWKESGMFLLFFHCIKNNLF